jgi:hypothetical protein
MANSSLDIVLGSIRGFGDTITQERQRKLEEERAARLEAMQTATHEQNLTKGSQEITRNASEQKIVDAFNAKVEAIAAKKAQQGIPEVQKEVAPAPMDNEYDQHLTDPALRDSLGLNSANVLPPKVAAQPLSKPNDVEEYRKSLDEFAPFGDLGKTYLGGKKDLAEIQNKEELAKSRGEGGGLFSGWRERSKQWDTIGQMDPGSPEREAAEKDYYAKWATSGYFGTTPLALETTGKKAAISGKAGQIGKAAGEQAAISGGQGTAAYEASGTLRKEFQALPEIKDLKVINANRAKANDTWKAYKGGNASPYEVDQSLAFFANKALDPGSVVMPGEFERFAKGLGYKKLEAFVQAFVSGGLKLTDREREGMLNIVNRSFEQIKGIAKPQYEEYVELSKRRGVDPQDVVGGIDYIFNPKNASREALPTSGGPKVGTVEGGYRFKGGNPADKNSWELVQ